jgi:hypothetical protein
MQGQRSRQELTQSTSVAILCATSCRDIRVADCPARSTNCRRYSRAGARLSFYAPISFPSFARAKNITANPVTRERLPSPFARAPLTSSLRRF